MSALGKLRVFFPQFVGIAIATGAGMGIAALAEAGRTIALIPVAVVGSCATLFTLASVISKANTLFDHVDGWEQLGVHCKNCMALEADRDELRRALLADASDATARKGPR